jgi:hypothetical protein
MSFVHKKISFLQFYTSVVVSHHLLILFTETCIPRSCAVLWILGFISTYPESCIVKSFERVLAMRSL